VQLLPVTNITAAHADFVTVRLNGVDTSGDPQYDLLPPSEMQHSPISEQEKKEMYQEMILSRWPYILMGSLALVILLLGCCIWKCCCRRRCAKKRKAAKTNSFLSSNKDENNVYVALEEHRKGAYADSQYSLSMHDYRQ